MPDRCVSGISVAATYVRGAPPYFVPLVNRAQEGLELTCDATVLDLATGAGRLTLAQASHTPLTQAYAGVS
jgi:hypothetical protein